MRIIPAVLLGGLIAATGCTAETPGAGDLPLPPTETEDCGARQLGAYIGHPASEDILARIRQWRGDKPIRVLKPGSVMTMDYRPERLNIFLDDAGVIKEFKCN